MSVDITRAPYRQSGNVVRDSSTETRLWVIWLYKKIGFQALFKFVKLVQKLVDVLWTVKKFKFVKFVIMKYNFSI